MIKNLWRFYVGEGEGGDTETLALVVAENDTEAMKKGFEALRHGREASAIAEYGIDQELGNPDDADQDELEATGYFSCTPIEDVTELQWALEGIPALAHLSPFAEQIAALIWSASAIPKDN